MVAGGSAKNIKNINVMVEVAGSSEMSINSRRLSLGHNLNTGCSEI
jgi:hypothetical protein